MISEDFRKNLIKKLSKFEDRVVYLHFYESENQTSQDMESVLKMIHSAIDFLRCDELSEKNIYTLRQLNEKYMEYKDWFNRTHREGHSVSSLWDI